MKIKVIPDKLLPLYDLKMVYDIYMTEAHRDQKANRELQALATVKSKVLAQGSPYRKGIERKVAGVQNDQPPPFHFERTENGWRLNLAKLMGR